jgi:hypothetical protein
METLILSYGYTDLSELSTSLSVPRRFNLDEVISPSIASLISIVELLRRYDSGMGLMTPCLYGYSGYANAEALGKSRL